MGWAGPGKGELARWADASVTCSGRRQLPRGDAGPPAPPLPPGPCRPCTAALHRRRPWDPEPEGRGLMGPPPWWDLSPTLTMRLHLLASLSGGGLAWRPGDHRWLAGEAGTGRTGGPGGSLACVCGRWILGRSGKGGQLCGGLLGVWLTPRSHWETRGGDPWNESDWRGPWTGRRPAGGGGAGSGERRKATVTPRANGGRAPACPGSWP